jgi:antitoxin component of RelBE/YafQ-DinJ toxin-antitoxin module
VKSRSLVQEGKRKVSRSREIPFDILWVEHNFRTTKLLRDRDSIKEVERDLLIGLVA